MRSVAFSLIVTLSLAAAAAGVAFLAGRSFADAPGSFERGVQEGERLGQARMRAEFARGSDAYEAVFARGRRSGFAEGRRRGRAEGAARGRRSGRASAFAGFDGGWDVGTWYLISLRPAGDGSDLAIGSRVALRRGEWYGLCGGRVAQVCHRGGRGARG